LIAKPVWRCGEAEGEAGGDQEEKKVEQAPRQVNLNGASCQ